MKNLFTLFLSLLVTAAMWAQKEVYFQIAANMGDADFVLNQAYQNDLGNNFKVTRLDYYISSIKIIHDGGTVTPVTGKYILSKGGTDINELLGTFNVNTVEGVTFSIGVQAPVNNQDPNQWTSPHPLAPQSPSMHWGWASGYRFVALEGRAGATLNTLFQMHSLGNENYFEQTQWVTPQVNGNTITIKLDADYREAVRGITLNSGPIDHGTNNTDLVVLQNFRDHVFSPAVPTQVQDIETLKAAVYPNPTKGTFTVDVSAAAIPITRMDVADATGKIWKQIYTPSPIFNEHITANGFYILKFYNGQTLVGYKKMIVLE